MKRAIVSVINDLVTDQRVHRHCLTLQGLGFDVLLIGRSLKHSPEVGQRPYNTHRMRLPFTTGPLFYASYNIALLWQLLFRRADLLLSNDLDTLPANFIASKVKGCALVYDSHEYFTEVPELVARPRTKAIWERIERMLVPKLRHAFTVSPAIADAYKVKYGVQFLVVRNLPVLEEFETVTPASPPVILYQGSVNLGRGIDLAIRAMQHLDGAVLTIAGSGDVLKEMRALAQELRVTDRVQFLGRLPFAELKTVTHMASLGISLEEDLGLNYRFALSNKLFDYIHAGIPVLTSDLPAMREVVEKYSIGEVLQDRDPNTLAQQIQAMLDQKKQADWRANCQLAAQQLNWQQESNTLEKTVRRLFPSK